MRRAAKVDDNHTEIVEALRAMGCTVMSLAAVGGGCPDIAVGIRGKTLLIEIKDGSKPPSRRKLTEDQLKWHSEWKGHVAIVENVEEAILTVKYGTW
jgi:Holliday junction resolvase